MNYMKHKDLIIEIRAKNDSNAATAREFAKRVGISYSDTVRRRVSQIINLDTSASKTKHKTSEKKWEEDTSNKTGYYEATVTKEIKTLEEALTVSNVDTDIWEVEKWVCNSWGVTSWAKGEAEYRNNYQVKVWLKKKEVTIQEALESVLPIIEAYTPKKIENSTGNGKVGVATFTDFHFGANVKDLIRTPNFDVSILLDYIHRAVENINSLGYSEVHVNMLGDFFESLSGLNHDNTWKSLGEGMWGANVMIVANEIIGTHLLSKIKNLKSVNIVSGNHDRMTISKTVDNTGEGGKVLWYMLKKDFPNIPVRYHNSVLSVEVDGINYLLTHGDKGYSKKDMGKFIMDYGNTGIYNLVLEGHLHSRIVKRAYKSQRTEYEDIEMVSFDDVNYRKIVCASLFTGNWFSESLGFGSAAGLTVCENNGKGKPNVFDFSL